MPTFIAFLRAVNVGKRQYPMAELREALTAAGFEEVETHIQTGNVLFRTGLRSRQKVIAALEKAMLEDRGFEVPVVLMTPAGAQRGLRRGAATSRERQDAPGALPHPAGRAADRGGRRGARGEVRARGGGPGREARRAPAAEQAVPRGHDRATPRWSAISVSPPPVT